MNSILGQEAQMLRVRGILEYLASEGLIANVMDPETAEKMVRDKLEDVSDLSDRFWEVPQIVKLMEPFSGDCCRVWFPYAEYWLFDVVACDRFLRPDAFDLERVMAAIQRRLDETYNLACLFN